MGNTDLMRKLTIDELINEYPMVYKEYLMMYLHFFKWLYSNTDILNIKNKEEYKVLKKYRKLICRKYGIILKNSGKIFYSIIENGEKFASTAPKIWCDYKHSDISMLYHRPLDTLIIENKNKSYYLALKLKLELIKNFLKNEYSSYSFGERSYVYNKAYVIKFRDVALNKEDLELANTVEELLNELYESHSNLSSYESYYESVESVVTL